MIEQKRQVYEFDEFRVDAAKRQLLREGEVVPITSKAFDLLLLLVESGSCDLTKDQILEKIWPGQILEESNLTVNISAVRRALGEKASSPRYLVTIPGQGYRFVANVRVADERTEAVLIETEAIALITVEEETTDPIDMRARTRLSAAPGGIGARVIEAIKQPAVAATLIVLALAVSGLGFWYYWRTRNTARPLDSIAVLPFVNASGDPNTEYLSDGITESIINNFSQLATLRVVPRSNVFRYKGQQINPEEVGRKLGVRAIITGRIVQHGDKINVQAELVDVEKDSQLWGGQYDRSLNDLQSVQSDISRQILEKLRLRLTGEQVKPKHTPSPAAYQEYLRGSYFLNLGTDEACAKAIDALDQAIQLDPDYALPYAGLARAYTQMSARSMAPKEAAAKAKDATLKALALDGALAEAHLGLGRINMWNDWDFAGAEQEMTRAIELNPNEPTSHSMYAELLGCTLGRFDKAIPEMQRAVELDPLSLLYHYDAAYLYYCARQPEHIIEEARKMIELDQNAAGGRRWLGAAYVMQGHYQEAIAEYKSIDALSAVGYTYALAGRRDEAHKVIAQLQERSQHQYINPCIIAYIYGALGEKDQAFEWLEKGFAERNDQMASLKTDPWFDSLRSDPRFTSLLQRIGLTP